MTVTLSAQQVLFIHARLIEATGGEHGVLDLGLLQAAVARPQATFDGADLYASLFQKAAALMESLAQNHPFVDGNKRTAITAAALFLLQNGRLQTATKSWKGEHLGRERTVSSRGDCRLVREPHHCCGRIGAPALICFLLITRPPHDSPRPPASPRPRRQSASGRSAAAAARPWCRAVLRARTSLLVGHR